MGNSLLQHPVSIPVSVKEVTNPGACKPLKCKSYYTSQSAVFPEQMAPAGPPWSTVLLKWPFRMFIFDIKHRINHTRAICETFHKTGGHFFTSCRQA